MDTENKRNSFGLTKEEMNAIYSERGGKKLPRPMIKHICYFKPCKSKAASQRCRICGDKKPEDWTR